MKRVVPNRKWRAVNLYSSSKYWQSFEDQHFALRRKQTLPKKMQIANPTAFVWISQSTDVQVTRRDPAREQTELRLPSDQRQLPVLRGNLPTGNPFALLCFGDQTKLKTSIHSVCSIYSIHCPKILCLASTECRIPRPFIWVINSFFGLFNNTMDMRKNVLFLSNIWAA